MNAMSTDKKINKTLNALIKRGNDFDEREAAFIEAQAKELTVFRTALVKEKGSLYTEGKKLLLAVITNKSIPLLDRWNVFAEAPAAFKNYSSYLPKRSPEFDSFINIHLADEERGTIVNMTDWGQTFIFNVIKHGEGSLLEWTKSGTLTNVALLEDILTHNLGSFCYDW